MGPESEYVFSTQSALAVLLNNRFLSKEGQALWTWICEEIAPGDNPPSSTPLSIFKNYWKSSFAGRNDPNDAILVRHKSALQNAVAEIRAKELISQKLFNDITQQIESARHEDIYPVLLVMKAKQLEDRTKSPPPTSGLCLEWRVEGSVATSLVSELRFPPPY